MTIISSQRYLDDVIVQEKRDNKDYDVLLAEINVDGDTVYVLIDGHHSWAAARLDGRTPRLSISAYNYQAEIDYLGLDNWLEQHWIDSSWYDVETGCEYF